MAIIFLVFASLALTAVIGVVFIVALQRVVEWVVDRVEDRAALRRATSAAVSRDDYRPAA